MKITLALISFVTLWLASFAVLVACQLSLAAYRTKGIPDLSALWALCAGVMALWLVGQPLFDGPVFPWLMLFFSGFCGFSAGAFASAELRATKTTATTLENVGKRQP